MNRATVMESKMFALLVGEKVRDELTDEQIAMFVYYTHNRKEPDFTEGGRFLHEIIAPFVDEIIKDLLERDHEYFAERSGISGVSEESRRYDSQRDKGET